MRKLFVLLVIYLAFIALGLPDALLGSSWTLVRMEFDVRLASLGAVTTVLYFMTIIATVNAPTILRKLETKWVTAISILFTATALLLISQTSSFYYILVYAIPLGIGQGAIDVSLNHYMSVHYKAKHMNFLHSMYGVGVTTGPFIMSLTLKEGEWRTGYFIVGTLLAVIAILVLFSSKLWETEHQEDRDEHHKQMSYKTLFKTPGILESVLIFTFYVNIESLGGVWIASYFYLVKGTSIATAALLTSFLFLGLTTGRMTAGLLSDKLGPLTLIRVGFTTIFLSALLLLLPINTMVISAGTVFLYGFGCAPIYPNMMYLNKHRFPKEQLSKTISAQMAIGYTGFGVLTPLLGVLFDWFTISLFPLFVLGILGTLVYLHRRLLRLAPITKDVV